MAQQTINVGAAPNDGTGDPLQTSFIKCNDNFTELYARGGAATAPQGRLTLQTATPVMTTTQSAKTTLYYSPYCGSQIGLYDGSAMVPTTFTELSVATTDTTKSPSAIGASKVNDWFVWSDAGTIRLGHGPDWTSDTARSAGTALVMVSGVLLNSVSITNGPAASRGTYVGTTRSNASSQLDWILGAAASGGTAAVLNVWNCYNRVTVATNVTDNGAGYTYSSATIRQARASAGNQISFVLGLQEDGVQASYATHIVLATVSGTGAYWGPGVDSTTTFGGQPTRLFNGAGAIQAIGSYPSFAVSAPAIGRHVITANEAGDGTNATTFCALPSQILSAVLRM